MWVPGAAKFFRIGKVSPSMRGRVRKCGTGLASPPLLRRMPKHMAHENCVVTLAKNAQAGPRGDALVHYDGDDAHAGRLRKYSRIRAVRDVR